MKALSRGTSLGIYLLLLAFVSGCGGGTSSSDLKETPAEPADASVDAGSEETAPADGAPAEDKTAASASDEPYKFADLVEPFDPPPLVFPDMKQTSRLPPLSRSNSTQSALAATAWDMMSVSIA